MQQDRLGQQIGDYRLTDILGRGGYATVYLGEHVHLGMKAAIKILNVPDLTEEEQATFLKEARIIANFDHPHIVKILDFNIEQGRIPYMVMQWATNGSLRVRHPEGEIVPLDMVISYTDQVASALHYAHSNSVLHCDIKPANMLIGKADEILLSDFGIAVVDHKTGLMQQQQQQPPTNLKVAGTVEYMAPERFDNPPRRASDQYSLAIVVYEWLAGARPFEGTRDQIMFKQVTTPPPSLLAKNEALPKEVEHVIMKALAKAPDQRYATVQMFADALRSAAQPSTPRLDAQTVPTSSRSLKEVLPVPLAVREPIIFRKLSAEDVSIAPNDADEEPEEPARFMVPVRPTGVIPQPLFKEPVEDVKKSSQLSDHEFDTTLSSPLDPEKYPLPDPTTPMPPVYEEPQQHAAPSVTPAAAEPDEDAGPTTPASPSSPLGNGKRPGKSTPQLVRSSPLPPEPDQPEPARVPRQDRTAWRASTDSPRISSDLRRYQYNAGARGEEEHSFDSTFAYAQRRNGSSARSRPRRVSLKERFALEEDFAHLDLYRWFRNLGMVLNVVSAVGLGLLQHSWYWGAAGFLFTFVLFRYCIRLVTPAIAGTVGIILAGYWGYLGWVLAAYVQQRYPVDWFPPLPLVAIAFFLVSGSLHINYIKKRLP